MFYLCKVDEKCRIVPYMDRIWILPYEGRIWKLPYMNRIWTLPYKDRIWTLPYIRAKGVRGPNFSKFNERPKISFGGTCPSSD